ncbi:MAG TPA: hypothetical protein EYP35_08830 [Desulfobacterales bacterium]|nr:hypothetical protein [Desulfobacterales bacterium]HIP40524.1 hypothetical protein [Desulfocapsa sulfexigens]
MKSGGNPIAFSRAYASNLHEDNGLGNGWVFNDDIQLEERSNGTSYDRHDRYRVWWVFWGKGVVLGKITMNLL